MKKLFAAALALVLLCLGTALAEDPVVSTAAGLFTLTTSDCAFVMKTDAEEPVITVNNVTPEFNEKGKWADADGKIFAVKDDRSVSFYAPEFTLVIQTKLYDETKAQAPSDGTFLDWTAEMATEGHSYYLCSSCLVDLSGKFMMYDTYLTMHGMNMFLSM